MTFAQTAALAGPVVVSLIVMNFPDSLGFAVLMLLIFWISGLLALSLLLLLEGRRALSAALFPVRILSRVLQLPVEFGKWVLNYSARKRGWNIIQSIALGLENYPRTLPRVRFTPVGFERVIYRELPDAPLQRTLKRRYEGLGKVFRSTADILSKMSITATDMQSVLQAMEADINLVHASYYTDDECLECIADWIVSPRTSSGEP